MIQHYLGASVCGLSLLSQKRIVFTGLVQSLGSIRSLAQDRFTLSILGNSHLLSDLAIGDSVAVDGVCLTVEELLTNGFVATASPETLARTTLGKRQTAAYVNLETSLRVGSKLGGHFVTGHVDGVGCLVKSLQTEQAWEMTFAAPPNSEQWHNVARYLIPKGSISVNGISLTVAASAADSSWFSTSVIPHTYAETNLQYLKMGDWVNLESDILGKYVDRLINHRLGERNIPDISLTFLQENGYV